jgi:hypothetical protein
MAYVEFYSLSTLSQLRYYKATTCDPSTKNKFRLHLICMTEPLTEPDGVLRQQEAPGGPALGRTHDFADVWQVLLSGCRPDPMRSDTPGV